MKKGFTLAEVLITLTIIGVVFSLLIPSLNNVKPDKEKLMYKKAIFTLQSALVLGSDEIISKAANSSAYWADTEVGTDEFCTIIAANLNTTGEINCSITGDADTPNFITINGTKWWGLGAFKFTTIGETHDIYVDVNGDKGKNTIGQDRLRMRVRSDGKVTTDSSWTTENKFIKDMAKVTE
ncbi:MAG: type II secretion system protein [Candidatus Gastranaerophilales bacterium]|nr:type II secretion system protein [Candidatus Gastranaerophilales bacterium]